MDLWSCRLSPVLQLARFADGQLLIALPPGLCCGSFATPPGRAEGVYLQQAPKFMRQFVRLSQSGKPLVIDLGCGFGASSLGLTQHGFAVLAVDASAHCIRYATALARRWQLPESCASFVQCGAEEALAAAQSVADIDVKWILINFPTPFAVQSDRAGLSCSKEIPDDAVFQNNPGHQRTCVEFVFADRFS